MVTRRDFLKLTGASALAAGTVMVGLSPAASEALGQLKASRLIKTLWNESLAACAVSVSVAGAHFVEVASNREHPLACPEATPGIEDLLRQLQSPERLHGPLHRSSTRRGSFQPVSWDAAAALVSSIFTHYQPGEIAFVLSDYPDHLSDLVQLLAGALGGSTVLRFSASSLLDGRLALQDASRMLFGLPYPPYFDLLHSDLVFSFGANGSEPWLARYFGLASRPAGQSWLHFTPYRSASIGAADEWVCLRPGSEAMLAQGLGRLIALIKAGASVDGDLPPEVEAASRVSAISVGELSNLARRFVASPSALALPGADCLGGPAGLSAAQAVLALNGRAGRLGCPGGVYLSSESPLYPELNGRTASLAEVGALIQRMESGQVKALFVHGVDLVTDLPAGLGVERALQQVEQIVLLNSVANETTPLAHALFPDHLPLESWGYQRLSPAVDRALVSAIQPVLPPRDHTRSTVALLLEAAHRTGRELGARLPYRDELEFLQQAVRRLPWGAEIDDPWEQWLRQGGWWSPQPSLVPPVSLRSPERWYSHPLAPWALGPSGDEFYLHFIRLDSSPTDKPARTGEPCRVGMHPAAARRLGLRSGDLVRLATASAEIEARIAEQADLRLDTLALPLKQNGSKHPNPLDLVSREQNESGDLAYQSLRVRVLAVDEHAV